MTPEEAKGHLAAGADMADGTDMLDDTALDRAPTFSGFLSFGFSSSC